MKHAIFSYSNPLAFHYNTTPGMTRYMHTWCNYSP